MPRIELETQIDAPVERVFDLARDVDLHTETMDEHDERAVGGTTSGRLEEGDVVTWRATHFGIPMELTVEITVMDRPHYFRDEQIDGPFASMVHHHEFTPPPTGVPGWSIGSSSPPRSVRSDLLPIDSFSSATCGGYCRIERAS